MAPLVLSGATESEDVMIGYLILLAVMLVLILTICITDPAEENPLVPRRASVTMWVMLGVAALALACVSFVLVVWSLHAYESHKQSDE